MKDALNTIPPQHRADGSPEDQAVILAKHDEEHAGAALPAGHPVPAVEIDRNGAFTQLLVYQGENVGRISA